jgi:hypothetical protein
MSPRRPQIPRPYLYKYSRSPAQMLEESAVERDSVRKLVLWFCSSSDPLTPPFLFKDDLYRSVHRYGDKGDGRISSLVWKSLWQDVPEPIQGSRRYLQDLKLTGCCFKRAWFLLFRYLIQAWKFFLLYVDSGLNSRNSFNFKMSSSRYIFSCTDLKGQSHEIFHLNFSSWNTSAYPPDWNPRVNSRMVSNSWR